MLTWQFMTLARLFIGVGIIASFAVLCLAAKALKPGAVRVLRALGRWAAYATSEKL